jgi:hypothetical protein
MAPLASTKDPLQEPGDEEHPNVPPRIASVEERVVEFVVVALAVVLVTVAGWVLWWLRPWPGGH